MAAAPAAADEPIAAPAVSAAPTAGEAPVAPRPEPLDAKVEAPIVAYAYTARGTSVGRVGAQAYGVTLMGKGQKSTLGGGALVWGAPIDRLTLVVDAPRDVYLQDHFAPSAAAIVRLLGAERGFSLGALAKYKVEGFGSDPEGEMESEIEGGILLSYAESGLHVDLNAITGFGLTEDGEVDSEARLRVGYDLSSLVRAGIDAQARYRLAGERSLLNGSSADFAAGAQVIVGSGPLFAALTGGPATMGLSSSGVVGGTVMFSVSGTM